MTPDAYTIKEFFIEVGDGHQLYVHDWGNKASKNPIIFLHGGPGGGCGDKHKNVFDPSIHRVIFFDQRGSGRSLPYGSLEHNTTDDILGDITKIADHLRFKQFILVGRSWGTTLALAYAIKNPKRVKAMALCSIFTGSKYEIEWIDQGIFRTHYPEVWEQFLARTPKKYHDKPAEYHYRNISEGSEQKMRSSAIALGELEGHVATLDDRHSPIDPVAFDPTYGRILTHYFTHDCCFMPDRYILNNAHKLTMPVWMVHGRYDMNCRPIAAYELSKKMPSSRLIWVISGHKAEHEMDTAIRTILLQLR